MEKVHICSSRSLLIGKKVTAFLLVLLKYNGEKKESAIKKLESQTLFT